MGKIIVAQLKNFEKYKGRSDVKHHSWFRCSNRLLEDPDFFEFNSNELLSWIYLMSLSSQKNSDTVIINLDHVERVCRIKKRDFENALQKLKGKQIDILDGTDAVQIRNGHGTDTGATEQNKTEQNKQNRTGPDERIQSLVTLWNERRGDLPEVARLNKERKEKIRARLKEEPDLGVWTAAIDKLAASSFCRGQNDRGWVATFDFLLQESSLAKILEGKYDDRNTGRGSGPTGMSLNL